MLPFLSVASWRAWCVLSGYARHLFVIKFFECFSLFLLGDECKKLLLRFDGVSGVSSVCWMCKVSESLLHSLFNQFSWLTYVPIGNYFSRLCLVGFVSCFFCV